MCIRDSTHGAPAIADQAQRVAEDGPLPMSPEQRVVASRLSGNISTPTSPRRRPRCSPRSQALVGQT
eukprot:12903630-Prorocentrum_lima.AAC.1